MLQNTLSQTHILTIPLLIYYENYWVRRRPQVSIHVMVIISLILCNAMNHTKATSVFFI